MLSRAIRAARRLFGLYILRDPRLVAHRRWIRDRGDETLRVEYPLGPESVVLDVGGYNGDWAATMYERYGCRIHVFEPVPQFYERIRERFAEVPKVAVHNYGLADRDAVLSMSLSADGSSVFQDTANRVEAQLRDVAAFIREQNLETIDLIKINIEGGEFDLLPRMLDEGIVARCRDLQIQFHTFYPDAMRLRRELRDRLAATHDLTYDYYFIWENWRRREGRT